MTNLIEKLKKGELPQDFYYVDVPEGSPIAYGYKNYIEIETPEWGYVFYIEGDEDKFPDYVKILSKVPTYDEYKQLKEILKECREEISEDMYQTGINEVGKTKLLMKIDELLK